MGSSYSELGQHHKALEYQEKALAIRLKAYGEEHPDTATSYNNVGSSYSELRQHHKALEYAEKALKIRQDKLGNIHPDTIQSNLNYAFCLLNQGSAYKAFQWLEKLSKALPPDHPEYADLLKTKNQIQSKMKGFRPQQSLPKHKKKKR